MKIAILFILTKNYNTMKNLNTFTIWLKKDKEPIILNLPFHSVDSVVEFIMENFDIRPRSVSKH